MGSFYTSITLRTVEQTKVINALRAAHREAYVSPPENGCTVVYDRECEEQDIEELNLLAGSLSAKLRCPALGALVHDDDVLVLMLHENGKLTDEYNSAPRYFESGEFTEPEGGDAARLCRAFGTANVASVESALRTQRAGGGDQGFVFEMERHEALVEALGLPAVAVTGYTYIEQGDVPEGTNLDSFVHID
jgi:hypothetical protein